MSNPEEKEEPLPPDPAAPHRDDEPESGAVDAPQDPNYIPSIPGY